MKPKILVASLCIFAAPAIAQSPSAPPKQSTAPLPVVSMPTPVTASVPSTSSASEHKLEGTSAYYSGRFNGRKTASGQIFNNGALTAAHNTLPFGTRVKVTNVKNNKSVVVRINDRGPTTPGRILDLSRAAASRLGFVRAGHTEVKVEIVANAPEKRARKQK